MHPDADRVDRILTAFADRYARATPYTADRQLASELSLEARPAVDSLLVAAEAEPDERARVLDHHEGLALVTLLGRRAGVLGATPTAAVGIVRAIFGAFEEAGASLPRELEWDLTTLCMEGYVAGREERLVETNANAGADAQPIVRLAPGCLLLILAGEHGAEMLERIVDRFGREMLKANARVGVVELSRLAGPAPDRATEVFGADAAARMLGIQCIFTGASDAWVAAARQAGVSIDLLSLEPTFDAALDRALALAGWELRRPSRLPAPLRTLLGK